MIQQRQYHTKTHSPNDARWIQYSKLLKKYDFITTVLTTAVILMFRFQPGPGAFQRAAAADRPTAPRAAGDSSVVQPLPAVPDVVLDVEVAGAVNAALGDATPAAVFAEDAGRGHVAEVVGTVAVPITAAELGN